MEPRTRTRKRARAAGAVALAALLFPPVSLPGASDMREVVDETGRRVDVPRRVERVVSLAPNLTEIVYALGLEARLVGVTNQCDYPPAAAAKPKAGDVVNPSVERILEFQPDVVLGTPAGNRWTTVGALEEVDIPLYGVNPRSVDGILTSIRNVAELLGVPARGQDLAQRLRTRLEAVDERLAPAGPRPRVLFVVWLRPLITAGSETFLNDVLQRAGARSVTADLEQDWPRLSLEEVVERDPDYLVLPRTDILESMAEDILTKDPWRKLRAVEQGRILWVDEAALRPGPRIVQAVEELARKLHDEEIHSLKATK